ncbi:MAG TPA: cytochrome c [Gemmatimonadaceae bacterium]|nr:cytochrome c [Gemmatimonadaceae bacterium]
MRRADRASLAYRVALVLAGVMCAACSDRPGRGWDWERMRSQPRYQAYGASAFFPDGKSMQAPPSGTVSRESGADAEADAAARAATASPSAAMLRRGADRFHIFCAVCHGERGDGRSIVAANMEPPKPPSLLSAPVRALPPDALHAVISGGFGRMPSYANELSPADRWAVVAYVRALQREHPAGAAMDSASAPGAQP